MMPDKKPLRLFVITTFGEVGPCGPDDLPGLLTQKAITTGDTVRQSNGRILGPVSEVIAGRTPLTSRLIRDSAPPATPLPAPEPPAGGGPAVEPAPAMVREPSSSAQRRIAPRQSSRRLKTASDLRARSAPPEPGTRINRRQNRSLLVILLGVGALAIATGIYLALAMLRAPVPAAAAVPTDTARIVSPAAPAITASTVGPATTSSTDHPAPPVVSTAQPEAAVVQPPKATAPPPATAAPAVPATPASAPAIAWDPCDQGPSIGRNNGSGWEAGWMTVKLVWEVDAVAGAGNGHLLFLGDLHEHADRHLLTSIADGTVWIALHAQVRFHPLAKKGDKSQWTSLHLLHDAKSPAFVFGSTRKNNMVTWHAFPKVGGKNVDSLRSELPMRDPAQPGWLVLRLDLHAQGSDMTMWADPPADRDPGSTPGQHQANLPFTHFDMIQFSGNGADLRLFELRIGRTWNEVKPPH